MQDPVTIAQAAERLQCSERNVWRLIKQGHLATVKIVGLTRIVAESLDNALTNGVANDEPADEPAPESGGESAQ